MTELRVGSCPSPSHCPVISLSDQIYLTQGDARQSRVICPPLLALTPCPSSPIHMLCQWSRVPRIGTRLEKKGYVVRDRSTRPHLYSAASSKEDHVTDLLSEVLDRAGDRRAVLARFLGTVSLSETAFLRGVLDRRLRGTDRRQSEVG